MPVKSGYLVLAAGGGLLLWSGVKGKNWSQALRAIVSGKNPQTATLTAYPITTAQAAFSGGSGSGAVNASANATSTGISIATDAQRYVGTGYVWGGAPGDGQGHWDCSSFCNAVIGRDLQLAIPTYKSGAYWGQAHGPTTLVWLVWTGCFTIPRQDATAGDLAVWQTHMGIFIDNQHIISALDAQLGVRITTVSGAAPVGEVLRVRRLKAVTARG
jgi:cell wall-associated NlpC family hydrolase